MYVFQLCGSVSFLINSVQAVGTNFNAPGCGSPIAFGSQQEVHAVIWHFYLRWLDRIGISHKKHPWKLRLDLRGVTWERRYLGDAQIWVIF